jgi:hypothetical protein
MVRIIPYFVKSGSDPNLPMRRWTSHQVRGDRPGMDFVDMMDDLPT